MYKKMIAALVLFNLVAAVAFLSAEEVRANRVLAATATGEVRFPEVGIPGAEDALTTASGQRVIDYELLERYSLSQEDYEVLLRIVEAEAGGEDEEGKMLVANVVLNRVASRSFPNTVKEVVFQHDNGVAQFTPVYNGRYDSVKVSENTVKAVERVLNGEDISKGALYFAARRYADEGSMMWFDQRLKFLFTHGGHDFFTE